MVDRRVAKELIEAFNKDQFVLYAQAIVPMAASDVGPGCQEILVRYREEEEKHLPPGTFIPLLESVGLMSLLDRWVIKNVLQWYRNGLEKLPGAGLQHSSINISRQTLADRTFLKYATERFEANASVAHAVSFEIPYAEAKADNGSWRAMVERLRPVGCQFSIADVRPDGRAFDVAERMGATWVKFDGALVARVGCDRSARDQVKAMIEQARTRGLKSVCQGVETEATLNALREMGADYVQGFGIDIPKPLI